MNTGQTGNRGIEFSLPVAKSLGQVMYFLRSRHYPLDFMIQAPGYLGLVGLRRSRKIRATLAEIDRQFAQIIAEIRMCPSGGPVSRELWLYSRYGALRFIRVTATGIEEIDRQVILCRRDVPAEPADSPTVSPAGPAAMVSQDRDDGKELLRWLAKRCPEIRGEPATAGPVLPAFEPYRRPVRSAGPPAPGNDPAGYATDPEIPGTPGVPAAVCGISGEQPAHETADAIVPPSSGNNPEDPAEKSGTNPEHESGRPDEPGKCFPMGVTGTAPGQPAPADLDGKMLSVLPGAERVQSPAANEEVS